MTGSERDYLLRDAAASDAAAIARIYNYYVLQTVVSFEEQAVPPAEMAERIQEVASHSLPWLVAERAQEILGYAGTGAAPAVCNLPFIHASDQTCRGPSSGFVRVASRPCGAMPR